MPSDTRTIEVLSLLRRDLETFEAAVAMTAEDVRRLIERLETPAEDPARSLQKELGWFGANRIDHTRFAGLLAPHQPANVATATVVESALKPLDELAKMAGEFCVVGVGSTDGLYDAVSVALARMGRAFGAARMVQSIRNGRARPAEYARVLEAFPFANWNSSERGIAPPIIIETPGSQMRVGALSEFMDGRLKLVLVVRGECPPAPLVRLISPGTFVVQSREASDLAAFAEWSGPGVAALVPDSCAFFSHDPQGGAQTWERLKVSRMPKAHVLKPIAGLSASQQRQDIELLSLLAATPAVAPAMTTPVTEDRASMDPTDKLAAWILAQADLSGVE